MSNRTYMPYRLRIAELERSYEALLERVQEVEQENRDIRILLDHAYWLLQRWVKRAISDKHLEPLHRDARQEQKSRPRKPHEIRLPGQEIARF